MKRFFLFVGLPLWILFMSCIGNRELKRQSNSYKKNKESFMLMIHSDSVKKMQFINMIDTVFIAYNDFHDINKYGIYALENADFMDEVPDTFTIRRYNSHFSCNVKAVNAKNDLIILAVYRDAVFR